MDEDVYARLEREAIIAESELCPECPDPGLCMAEGECCAGGNPEAAYPDPDPYEVIVL